MQRSSGYIALHRAIFKHHLFKDEKPFTRLQAFTWLIAQASWCSRLQRTGRKLVQLDRGQLCTTTRTLAAEWGWHRSKVERFLRLLRADKMIASRALGTSTETAAETPRKGMLTIITLCNYSKFNDSSTAETVETRQAPGRRPRRSAAQADDAAGKIAPQPSNHSSKKAIEVSDSGKGEIRGRMGRNKPRHGARSFRNGTVWIDNGTDEWRMYAEDYKKLTGNPPFPQQYIGGSGRWFKVIGEEPEAPRRFPPSTSAALAAALDRLAETVSDSAVVDVTVVNAEQDVA